MALKTYLFSVNSAGMLADLGTTDDVVVGAAATLVADGMVFVGQGGGHSISIFGSVYGVDATVWIGTGTSALKNVIKIASSGQLMSDGSAIELHNGTQEVINHGHITADNYAVIFHRTSAGTAHLANTGTIMAAEAVYLLGSITATIGNSGWIEGSGDALGMDSSCRASLNNQGTMVGRVGFGNLGDSLINSGTIDGTISMGDGGDTVRIRGIVTGLIDLSGGDDTYNGRGAPVQDLSIDGGAGGDTFVLGAASEAIVGGAGADTIDVAHAAHAIQISLVGNGSGTGLAEGDSFSFVENIWAGRFDDRLTGSDADNGLTGNDGDDSLLGGLGNDSLSGGLGADRLTGGGGNDRFYFDYKPGGPADVITDFRNLANNDDTIVISAFAFGGGLAAGPLALGQFRSQSGHAAVDADDRFLFDTGTKSLWFDVDGNGAAAAVMIADLQANATFTLADISVI